MAKRGRRNSNGETNGEPHVPKTYQQYNAPAGYESRTSDIVGFWNPDQGPVHFVPRLCRAFDSNVDNAKPSVLIIGESVGEQTVYMGEQGNQEAVEAKPKDMIGVWYKPGMASIKNLADVAVFMYPTGEQDTGKPNPMTTFFVGSKKEGTKLMVHDDYRKRSRHTVLPFEVKGQPITKPSASDDDEDFGEANV